MEFYEVLCWSVDGKFLRVSSDDGLQWFTTLEQAERIAAEVAADPKKPVGMTKICVYEARPVKTFVVAPRKSPNC